MGLGLSLLLDLCRFSAAVTVVFGHLTQAAFSTGWPGGTRLALEAVAVFFVLSGFVIRHATVTKERTLEDYATARAARIYSVALPALLLTLVLDTLSARLNPGLYARWSADADAPVARIAVNLLFLGQAWTLDVSPLSDSPYWSLNYECVYYAAFGCFVFLARRVRRLALAGLVMVVGPKVFLLFPLWLLGVWLHDRLPQLTRAPAASATLIAGAGAGWLLWFGSRMPDRSESWLAALVANPEASLGFSRHAADFYVVGCLFAIALVGANGLSGRFEATLSCWARPIRVAASATFSTYLYHFPVLLFLAAAIPYDHASTSQKLALLAAVLLICFALSRATEVRKAAAARLLRGLADRLACVPACIRPLPRRPQSSAGRAEIPGSGSRAPLHRSHAAGSSGVRPG
jgi:peptidoglycan/LPS O-acetylase OafA/YrhL